MVVLRDGYRLRVRTRGSGAALLLIHGFSGSGRGWGDVPDRLDRGRRLILIDLLGHGESDKPTDPRRYRMDAMVEDVAEVLRAGRISACDLVGYSMGARVSLAVAAWKPELVRRLVLESGSPGLATENERTVRRRADEILARRISEEGIGAFLESWLDLPVLCSLRDNVHREVWDRVEAQRASNDPAALAAVLRGLGTGTQPSLWAELPRIRHPALLMTGRLDPKFTVLAERMAGALPHAKHVAIPGAGHRVHLERPQHWLRVIEAFLRTGDPSFGSGVPEARFPP